MKRAAEGLLKIYRSFAIALDILQKSNASLSDAEEVWEFVEQNDNSECPNTCLCINYNLNQSILFGGTICIALIMKLVGTIFRLHALLR